MEESAVVQNMWNGPGDQEVLNSLVGDSLVQLWTSERKIDEERYYYECSIDPKEYHIIGCDDDQRRKLLLYRSHFVGSTFRSYISDTPVGVIGRVFKKYSPEISPNISYYSQDEYPHRDFALSCGILSSFCFLFKRFGKFGVMEIVSACNQDVVALRKFCESFKEFDWSYSFANPNLQHLAIPEIDHFLEVACQIFQLPLTQYWHNVDQVPNSVNQFSYREFKILMPWWCQFKDACLHKKNLYDNEGPLGNSCRSPGALFCRDITALSIAQYPFAHYARNCGSISCFTMHLCNIFQPYTQCILEFFLPAHGMNKNYHQTLFSFILTTMQRCLPNYKLASGEQLGQGFYLINAFNVGQPPSSLPHQAGLEQTRSMNLFKIGPEQRSNFKSYEKASQPRRSEEIFGDEEYSMAFERVENLVEVSPNEGVDKVVEVSIDEDNECAASTASKRLKKTKIPMTAENITKYFGRPLKDAANSFGVSPSTFKRRCRSVGITWWQSSKRRVIDHGTERFNFSSSMRALQDTPAAFHRSQALEKMTVKATYNSVTIKFGLTNLSGISELEDNVIKRLHLERNSFSIKYQDNDDELILIGCDEDVQECMKLSRSAEKATIKMLIHPPVNYAP